MQLFLLIIGVVFYLLTLMNFGSLMGFGPQGFKRPRVVVATIVFATIATTAFYCGIG